MDEPNALEFEESEEELTADSEQSESGSVSNNSESGEEESSSDEMTLGDLFQSGEMADDDDDEDEESGDDDWDPSKDNPKRRKPSKKGKNKKQKLGRENSEEPNVTSSKDFELTEVTSQGDDMCSEDEDNNEPEKKSKSEAKPRKKDGNKKKKKKLEMENETVENGLMSTQKLKKKAKKSHLKLPNNDSRVEKTNTLENSSESPNVLHTSFASNSPSKNSNEQVKQANREKESQASPGNKTNQPQANDVSSLTLLG